MTFFELKFFEWEMPTPPLLLRSGENGHEIFARGEWSATDLIAQYYAGDRHDIEPIDEDLAREKYPTAF